MKKLNFGSGNDIKEGWDNVDIQKSPKLTKSFDFDKFPYPLKDNTYDYVLVRQVIEHVLYPDRMLFELHRICKNKGIIRIETAHYTNKGAYNDMQHLHFLNENAFKFFVETRTLINERKNMFKIKELVITPTAIGKFIPNFLRQKLSLFLNGLNSQIHCTYEVLK